MAILSLFIYMGIGDWGLVMGDWAQSPIPNPQSPLKYKYNFNIKNKTYNSLFIIL